MDKLIFFSFIKSIIVITIKNINNNIPNGIVINKNQGITPQKQFDSLQDSFVIKLVIVAPIYPIIKGLKAILNIKIIPIGNFIKSFFLLK